MSNQSDSHAVVLEFDIEIPVPEQLVVPFPFLDQAVIQGLVIDVVFLDCLDTALPLHPFSDFLLICCDVGLDDFQVRGVLF